jgi:hypothetical protein
MYRILVTYIAEIESHLKDWSPHRSSYSEWLLDGHKNGKAAGGLIHIFETDNLEEAKEKRDHYREQFNQVAYYDIVQVIE